MSEVYLNGLFLPSEEAKVSVMDRGFLLGDGVYEVVPSYGGHFLGLDLHLDRLDDSLSSIRLENPLARQEWRDLLTRLISARPAADRYVYLQVTRGAAPERSHLCPPGVPPTVLAMARPIESRGPDVERQGVSCITRPDIRWQRCEIKSISLLASVMMRREAEDEGALEAILVREGMVTEGASSNVFVVKGGEVLTPPKGHWILPGVTRDLLVGMLDSAGIRVAERRIPFEELAAADEIWLSSSTREVLPVTRLDGAPVGGGRPGPLWRQANGLYQAYKTRVRSGHV